jgi:phenylalanyl-tRNA synthetase beta chain
MECGQPLHVFDYAQIKGRQIIVRAAQPGEQFLAIDHRTYDLTPQMCVIADRDRSVALGGVMGGADSEVSDTTTDLLIEAAEFDPLSIRTTARQLNLHSPSSYRFERGVDPEGVDWASRRCCELILDMAGGELAEGVIDVVGKPAPKREPIALRFSQLKRILGIEIDRQQVCRILVALGNQQVKVDPQQVQVIAPSWRRDLTREVDLVEEVARIHGYDKIPEDVSVPMVPSHRSDEDRVMDKVRRVLTAARFDEALTASVVSQPWSDAFSPWTDAEPLACDTPMLRGADRLRRSLIPSLLEARRINQSLGNPVIELFEIAKVYLPRDGELPDERQVIGITSGGDYFQLKGVLEGLLSALNPALKLRVTDNDARGDLLDGVRSSKLMLERHTWGYLGELRPEGRKQFGLRSRTTIAEVDFGQLARIACLVPQYAEQSPYPAICQDVNLIVDEQLRWAELADTIGRVGGDCLEQVDFREIYRDPEKDGPGKKRLLFSFTLRSADRTLTGEEAETIRDRIVEACRQQHQAVLLA